MNINYFDCEYQDCGEVDLGGDEGMTWCYGCTHPSRDIYNGGCLLNNKWDGILLTKSIE